MSLDEEEIILADDDNFEKILRPQTFEDYVGQQDLKDRLSIAIEAAKQRDEPMPSILLLARSGYGKTTIAQIISNEYGSTIKTVVGTAIESKADVLELLTKVEKNSVLFLDELQTLKSDIQEMFYTAIEDFKVTVKLGKKDIHHIKINPFCLIGATTHAGKISEPFRNRFGIVHEMSPYSNEELATIVSAGAKKLDLNFESEDLYLEVAKRGRSVPRTVNKLLLRIRDYAQVKNNGVVNKQCLDEAMLLEGINENGLNKVDLKYLTCLYKAFGCEPAGLNAILSSIGEAKETVENSVEPFLFENGYITKTKRGRVLTRKGLQAVGI